ncbi:MAG: hypothetical protein M1827_000231 [Pycnora praestabilis]|nr:MAG: hypothetical protein M1827_000231 [Pycnora praestabilis]
MKFAKELEEDLVPEWRAKYLDYKFGKKKLKAVARALRGLNQTPKTPRRRPADIFSSSPLKRSPNQPSPISRANGARKEPGSAFESLRNAATPGRVSRPATSSDGNADDSTIYQKTPPMAIPERYQAGESSVSRGNADGVTNYGSIIATPPTRETPIGPPALELPDPALDPGDESSIRHSTAWKRGYNSAPRSINIRRTASTAGDAYEIGRTHTPSKHTTTLLPKNRSFFRPRRVNSTPGGGMDASRPLIQRIFSVGGPFLRAGSENPPSPDVPLEAYREFDFRQADFSTFLDKELIKIESFYKSKEAEANERLRILREQLHEMRDRRLQEVIAAQRIKDKAKHEGERESLLLYGNGNPFGNPENRHQKSHLSGLQWMKPIESALTPGSRFGKNTKALENLGSPSGPQAQQISEQHQHVDSHRDFVRRRTLGDDIPYRSAKRKLKLALQEFYRGLELLKSYALLNRTAFRKITKKYDKTVVARPAGRYMSEKVNKAWFVQSEVLDGHIQAVEDLYARYFERGNHKIAVGKLRSRSAKFGDYSGSVFRNGLLIAAGLVFGVQGLVYGAEDLWDPNPVVRVNTSYLLQIYAGYFLGLMLFLLFCLNCKIWTKAKINYVFIFEFDTRHALDWRQLLELPSFLLFLEGFMLWLNYQHFGSEKMFLYYPVILIGLTVLILFFPAPILYHRSRQWWLYSNWRLLLAGLYPVEFRDFFLGDMYCSQTYSMGNIELFFCLYAQDWTNPAQCNSSHSRLLGFFSTLPAVWDLAMDWSLCNPYARHPFLRDTLGYKWPWIYYLAMVLDPILRFNWIFYAIYSSDVQHSAVLSFFVGFSEVLRRGMWTLFRVENEHCTNVGRFRASRDVALPYNLPTTSTSSLETGGAPASDGPSRDPNHMSKAPSDKAARTPRRASGADIERAASQHTPPTSTVRQRKPHAAEPTTPIQRGITRVGTAMAQAHAQDFERKRRPGIDDNHDGHIGDAHDEGSSDEDEEEEENTQDVRDAQILLARHRSRDETEMHIHD